MPKTGLQIITHPTPWYSVDDVWAKAAVGFEDAFKPKRPMEQRMGPHSATAEQLKRFKNRSDRKLWWYESRCRGCRNIEEKQNLTDGLCESCRQQNAKEITDASSDGTQTSGAEGSGRLRAGGSGVGQDEAGPGGGFGRG